MGFSEIKLCFNENLPPQHVQFKAIVPTSEVRRDNPHRRERQRQYVQRSSENCPIEHIMGDKMYKTKQKDEQKSKEGEA